MYSVACRGTPILILILVSVLIYSLIGNIGYWQNLCWITDIFEHMHCFYLIRLFNYVMYYNYNLELLQISDNNEKYYMYL